ncbi:sensor histidine kinase [Streptococcus halichoeri]|uniref:sensor histidine kinase n=1 Tax=Streptococcus halichoeri TaxID=254785 RepID=UPI0013569A46|nr:GHKL domain-containing protein [Streptococcus halichoeri]
MFEKICDIAVPIFLFYFITKRKITFKEVLIGVFIRVLLILLFVFLNEKSIINDIFIYLSLPLYMLLFTSYIYKFNISLLTIFYALFPITLWNLIYRTIVFYLLPILGISNSYFQKSQLFLPIYLLSVAILVLFLKVFHYDFSAFSDQQFSKQEKKLLCFANFFMLTYYFLIQIISFIDYQLAIDTLFYRQIIVTIYFLLFLGILNFLDKKIREKLQKEIIFQKEMQLQNLENYSQHVEELYNQVRHFRHDYANILSTLKIGIEEDNMSIVKDVFEKVLKDSNRELESHKYDITRLVNIENKALKSLLAAKFIQMEEKGITVTLEIPYKISLCAMDLIDFITIVSIFFDNAIEATCLSKNPTISFAFFEDNNRQICIIENSTRDNQIDITYLFNEFESSKGKDRGIGLYKVSRILKKYHLVKLKTQSLDYKFTQMLEIVSEQ